MEILKVIKEIKARKAFPKAKGSFGGGSAAAADDDDDEVDLVRQIRCCSCTCSGGRTKCLASWKRWIA